MDRIAKPSVTACLLAGAMYLLLLITSLAGLTNGDSMTDILISTIVVQAVIFVLPAVFYARMKEIRYISGTRLRPFAPSRLVLITALLGLMLTGAFLINIALYSLSGESGFILADTYGAVRQIESTGGRLLTLLAVCIMPAVCEEFAFRGVILSELTRYGVLPAALCSAVLFSCAHFELSTLASNIFCGLILAALVLITGSVVTSMVLHAVYNIMTVYVIPYIWRVTFEPLGTLFTVFILAGIFIICLALALGETQAIYAEYARNPAMADDKPVKRETGLAGGITAVFINPAFLICILIYALSLAVL